MKRDTNLHDVTITSPEVSGMGTVVTLDGAKVKGVTRVRLDIALNKPNRLRLDILVDGVNAEAVEMDPTRPGARLP